MALLEGPLNYVRNSQVWNSIFRHGVPRDRRTRVMAIMSNVFLHLHPVAVRKSGIRLSFTWCMGGLTFFLFLAETVSGVLLKPDLSSWLVVVKLCCVLGVGIVGVLALSTSRLMERKMPAPSRSLVQRGMVLAGASQTFWWTAVIIGFLTNEAVAAQ